MAVTKVTASGAAGHAGIKVNDIIVVGEQQALVANTTATVNSNNVADLPTKVNAILTLLKAHGLMASS